MPKIDQSWSTISVSKVRYGDIGRDYQGETADQCGSCTCRRTAREAECPAWRTGGGRTGARALQQGHGAKKEGVRATAGNRNQGDSAGAIPWQQAHLVEPR